MFTKVSNIFVLWATILVVNGASRRNQFEQDGYSDENNDQYDTSRYKFAYGVEDHKTGDFKMHQEERDGDLVRGEYTMIEADGTLRTVKYTADKHNGFNAVISKAGEVRSEPAPAASYHHAVRVPAPANHHNPEDAPHLNAPLRTHHDLPHFAKYYAAKRNKVIESFAAENGGHYQSVNVDNNNAQTHYSYNLANQNKRREDWTNVPKTSRHVEVYSNQPVVFHMQRPQGFRKADEGSVVAHSDNEDGSDYEHNRNGFQENGFQENGYQGNSSVDDPEWKKFDSQGRRSSQYDNYRKIFESHFGKIRRYPNNEGAYSYMNFEGETNNGYELQHSNNQRQSV